MAKTIKADMILSGKTARDFEKKYILNSKSGTVEINLTVSGGKIEMIKLLPDLPTTNNINELENLLLNLNHEENEISEALCSININDYFPGTSNKEFIEALF